VFVVLTIAAASHHSKLHNPTASRYYDSCRPQHHSSALRDCRSQHDRILRRVVDLHPAAPDAEGNPACYYRDGWAADTSGSGINVYYFRESSNAVNGEQVTADVRLKDGSTASQIAAIDPGQSNDQIQFPGIDKTAVQEVLLTTSAGRCFVIGPSS